MNEEAIKHAFSLFTNDGYTGSYDQFKQLIQSNTDAKAHAFKLFTNDGYAGSEIDFDQLMGEGTSEPVKKKKSRQYLCGFKSKSNQHQSKSQNKHSRFWNPSLRVFLWDLQEFLKPSLCLRPLQ